MVHLRRNKHASRHRHSCATPTFRRCHAIADVLVQRAYVAQSGGSYPYLASPLQLLNYLLFYFGGVVLRRVLRKEVVGMPRLVGSMDRYLSEGSLKFVEVDCARVCAAVDNKEVRPLTPIRYLLD